MSLSVSLDGQLPQSDDHFPEPSAVTLPGTVAVGMGIDCRGTGTDSLGTGIDSSVGNSVGLSPCPPVRFFAACSRTCLMIGKTKKMMMKTTVIQSMGHVPLGAWPMPPTPGLSGRAMVS